MPNQNEARALLADGEEVSTEDLADALSRELAVPTVAVTLGDAGCVLHADGESRQYPALDVSAVDTTGAGDAFTAVFAACLTRGAPAAGAVDAAQSAAAWTVQHAGGYTSMPTGIPVTDG